MLDVVIPLSHPFKRVLLRPVGAMASGYTHAIVRCRKAEDEMMDFYFRAGQVSSCNHLHYVNGTHSLAGFF